jgi:hypothetical protein
VILMKTLMIAVAAAATLGASALTVAPAVAQPYGGGYHDGGSINERQQRLQWRISQGERRGTINRREARYLYSQLWEIDRLEARYRYDGRLSRFERADLDRRLDRLSSQIRYERHDADYRPRW